MKRQEITKKVLRQLVPNVGTVIVVLALLWAQQVGALNLDFNATSTTTISYQGRLALSDGTPVDDNLAMTFRIYNAATDGTVLWTETHPAVSISDGLFHVLLGSVTPISQSIFNDNTTLFLGITVGADDEMSPREQLASAPWAMSAMTVVDNSITSEKIVDGAVTMDDLVLEKYRMSGDQDPSKFEIYYRWPDDSVSVLDYSSCTSGNWCCNGDDSICYLYDGTNDSILEFSLVGAPSVACTLVHEEDDTPSKLYFATDTGNSCQSGDWCARVKTEGVVNTPPIGSSQVYYLLCGW